MDLNTYYKENKDDINSSIMEIASDLAVADLLNKFKFTSEICKSNDDSSL